MFHLIVWYTDAPWCRHCQALEPVYAEAAAQLKNQSSPVRLAKLDATEEKELAKEFEVSSFPALKLFTEGRRHDATEFTGMRLGLFKVRIYKDVMIITSVCDVLKGSAA